MVVVVVLDDDDDALFWRSDDDAMMVECQSRSREPATSRGGRGKQIRERRLSRVPDQGHTRRPPTPKTRRDEEENDRHFHLLSLS